MYVVYKSVTKPNTRLLYKQGLATTTILVPKVLANSANKKKHTMNLNLNKSLIEEKREAKLHPELKIYFKIIPLVLTQTLTIHMKILSLAKEKYVMLTVRLI